MCKRKSAPCGTPSLPLTFTRVTSHSVLTSYTSLALHQPLRFQRAPVSGASDGRLRHGCRHRSGRRWGVLRQRNAARSHDRHHGSRHSWERCAIHLHIHLHSSDGNCWDVTRHSWAATPIRSRRANILHGKGSARLAAACRAGDANTILARTIRQIRGCQSTCRCCAPRPARSGSSSCHSLRARCCHTKTRPKPHPAKGE